MLVHAEEAWRDEGEDVFGADSRGFRPGGGTAGLLGPAGGHRRAAPSGWSRCDEGVVDDEHAASSNAAIPTLSAIIPSCPYSPHGDLPR